MKIIDFIKNQWQLYPTQIIGAGLLFPAFATAIIAARTESISITYLAWVFLAIIGVIDLYIICKSKYHNIQTVTITRWVRNLLSKKLDNVVMFGFIVLVWWLAGPLFCLFYLHGFLNDHFNENK